MKYLINHHQIKYLAAQLEVTPQYVYRLLSGKKPSLKLLMKMSFLMKIELDKLATSTPEKFNEIMKNFFNSQELSRRKQRRTECQGCTRGRSK